VNYLDVARKAALGAGDLLKGYLGKVGEVEYKAKNSLVTEADRVAENLIIKMIKETYPAHGILAEESGIQRQGSNYLWIIDPLDGTTNFTHTYPFFSVSIALEIDGELDIGLIYDPIKDEMFIGERGRGARMNDKKIVVSGALKVEESNLCTGFIHTADWMVEENLTHFANFIRGARAVRRDGSAALDLCYVACGRYDGFWELGLNPWDTAAGYLIVEEAGGRVTKFGGEEYNINDQEIIASNGKIHEEMMNMLSSGRSKIPRESTVRD
jgi:myo-inositol-1(or 4)-monophosphatase